MNQLSFTATLKFKNYKKAMRNLLQPARPQTKPRNLRHPQRRRAWRITRKWFNRYERPEVRKGSYQVTMYGHDDYTITGVITDVRISKSEHGGRQPVRRYTVKPLPL